MGKSQNDYRREAFYEQAERARALADISIREIDAMLARQGEVHDSLVQAVLENWITPDDAEEALRAYARGLGATALPPTII